MSARSRLLDVVDVEGRKEVDSILTQARERAEALVREARQEAQRIREAEIQTPGAPDGDLRVREATAAFLARYARGVEALEEETLRALAELPPEERARLSASVVREVLGDLPPGVYRLEAPREVWDALPATQPPEGRCVRPADAEGPLALRSEDGSLAVSCGLDVLVRRYFLVESSRVARLLLGDEPG